MIHLFCFSTREDRFNPVKFDWYLLLSATVQGTGTVPQGVVWSLSGNLAAECHISQSGLLFVPLGLYFQTPEHYKLFVRAVSVSDPTQYAEVTVMLDQAYIEEPVFMLDTPGGNRYPPETDMHPGDSQQFSASLYWPPGVDISSSTTWMLIDNKSPSTTISPGGLLTIAADEPAGYVVVRATYWDPRLASIPYGHHRYTRVNILP